MGDVDFVNSYMGKMKDYLNDHLTKIIMLDTHLDIAGKKIDSLRNELNLEQEAKEESIKTNKDLMDRLANKETLYKESMTASDQLYVEKEKLKTIVEKLSAEVNRLKPFEGLRDETNSLKSINNTLTSELDAAKFREKNVTSDYAKLAKEFEALKAKHEKTAKQVTKK
jgi:predicted  nucleic acid-binding Zn-ribbon protein